jgi:uncharacterized protein (TIGR02001 family)
MKLSKGFMAIALLATASAVHAGDFSATVTAASDYDFRGVTQSAQNPALQGSVDFAADTGFYAGIWASNVDFGDTTNDYNDANVEVDYYVGWGGGEDITWDLGATYYTYVNAGGLNYPEYHGGLGWKYFDAKVWYSPSYGGLDGNERYFEGNVAYPLPANFGLTGHVGYSNGNGYHESWGQGSSMDWSAGVTYSWKHIDMALKWVDGSDLKTVDNGTLDAHGKQTDVFSSEARAIFTISTTFPWKDE